MNFSLALSVLPAPIAVIDFFNLKISILHDVPKHHLVLENKFFCNNQIRFFRTFYRVPNKMVIKSACTRLCVKF